MIWAFAELFIHLCFLELTILALAFSVEVAGLSFLVAWLSGA